MKIFDYEEVVMNWDSFTYPIAVGTPVSIDGVLADNSSAHGLIARTVFAKHDGGDTLKIMTGGIIDMEEIVAGYGQELSSAAVNALCGIHFYKNGVCIPSGGGGVTPEIMAQIENAQWKSEGMQELFGETVTTVVAPFGNTAQLSYSEPITADTLKVTFNGVEYTCPKFVDSGGETAYGAEEKDFSEFPFAIKSSEVDGNSILTQTAGTYTISASVETVTTTDTFKKAVNDIAGWKSESSEQLFSETVTTVKGETGSSGFAKLSYTEAITADTLIVTFNGVEYVCPNLATAEDLSGGVFGRYGAPVDIGSGMADFSDYPFLIISNDIDTGISNSFSTETPGTYTISASAETTTYTDTFKEAVRMCALREVATLEEADIAVVTLSKRIASNDPVSNISIYKDNLNDDIHFDVNSATKFLYPQTFYFWRTNESDVLRSGDYTLMSTSDNVLSISQKSYSDLDATGSTLIVYGNAFFNITSSKASWKFYTIGLTALSGDDGGGTPK